MITEAGNLYGKSWQNCEKLTNQSSQRKILRPFSLKDQADIGNKDIEF